LGDLRKIKAHAFITLLVLVAGIVLGTENASAHCRPFVAGDLAITKADYQVLPSIKAAETKFNEIYQSGRRLKDRVYQGPDGTYVLLLKNTEIQIPLAFIHALSRNIEIALERGYGEFLFYPDLGHAHLLTPETKNFKINSPSDYEALLAEPELQFLYHTAELIQMREGLLGPLKTDPWLQWRYFSRNCLSPMSASENLAVLIEPHAAFNTVREIPNYSEKGRVYFSASKEGCFPITTKGKTLWFDISFE
jgi:hypothetical protein